MATIADTATNWAVTLWMHSTNTTSFSNDVPAFATATTDVTIRRAQQFKPAPGAPLVWTYTSNNVVIASGATTADSDGFVTVTNLTLFKDPARTRLEITFPPVNRIHVVTVNADGSFSPARVEIFDGDTVEWRFSNRSGTIIPVNLGAGGSLCTNYLPYNPADPNEFTGPMPRAASGIFALSPEDTPYAVQDATWQNTNITGVFIRLRWDDVHLGTNQFDWDELDAEIAKAVANGKVYSLGFKAGVRGTPQWIFNPNRTTSPVTPLDFGFRSAGMTNYYGSPADANYRKHFNDLLQAAAAHLRERNAFYRALAYIKISGLNLYTHENRLPNETNDLPIWASLGQYTPTALYQFYDEQTALLAAEFPDKDMSYALIQDGFPLINNDGEYAGQSAPTNSPLPTGAAQTERILNAGRTNLGTRFVVQHNGLQPKPTNCPNEGIHPIVLDPNFHYVGSGCPNRWVLEQASLGQVTGYQIVSGITNLTDLESTFSNAWENSDGIFMEIYQANALSAVANGLPSGKTLGEWAEQFHQRRRTDWPGIPDPFPLTHSHTFTRTVSSNSGPQLLNFINGSNCSTNYGVVAILPDLSFTAIARHADGSVQLTLAVARADTLRVEYSEDLVGWTLLESRSTPAGTVEVTDAAATALSRFYRAALLGP